MGVYSPGFAFLKGYIEVAKNWARREKTEILCGETKNYSSERVAFAKGKIQALQEILELLETYDKF